MGNYQYLCELIYDYILMDGVPKLHASVWAHDNGCDRNVVIDKKYKNIISNSTKLLCKEKNFKLLFQKWHI